MSITPLNKRLMITEYSTYEKTLYSTNVKTLNKLKMVELCEPVSSKSNRVSTRQENITYKKRTLTHNDLFLL